MKKTFLIAVGACILAIVFVGSAMANKTLSVSADIPLSTSVTYVITEISEDGEWTDNHPGGLNFGTLKFRPLYSIFTPERYFAIDMGAAVGGVGKPNNISFTYTEGNNPNATTGSGRGGLGKKGTLSVTKAGLDGDGNPVADVPVAGPTMLSTVASLGTLTKVQFVNGWPRVYVGIYDGASGVLKDAGAEVFTADDAAGTYSGILQITATIS